MTLADPNQMDWLSPSHAGEVKPIDEESRARTRALVRAWIDREAIEANIPPGGEFEHTILPACPPNPRTCWRACRRNLLWYESPTAGMIQIGKASIKRRSSGHNFTQDEINAAVDEASDELVRTLDLFIDTNTPTCAVSYAIEHPDGVGQPEVAKVLGLTRQRVQQVETSGLRRLKWQARRKGKGRASIEELAQESREQEARRGR